MTEPMDPVGQYMTGFLLHNTPEQARSIAAEQRRLAEADDDPDDAAWWCQVMAWLDAQAGMAARLAHTPKVVAP